jgi:tetratricopeptide (TPR) repeat protein
MISSEIRRPLRALAWVLALAGFAQTASSESLFDPTDDPRGRLADKILEAQAKDGPHAKELIELFTALGLFYGENGSHALAIAAIEQALQVVRANYGLHSLEQLPLIRQRILNEESRGNFPEAWELEQELLSLARAHPEDLRTAAVFRELGDKRMDLFERYLAGAYPPQIVLGCYYSRYRLSASLMQGNCSAGSRRVAANAIFQEAQGHHAEAINVLVRAGLQSSNEVRELELDLLRSSYVHGSYETGRESLVRVIGYDVANAEPLMRRVDALVRAADWDLLFERSPQALATYQEIYAFLEQEGLAQAALDDVFSPEIPVVLPTFLPNPLASDGSRSTGHIDVAFEISRFGSSRRIKVLDRSNASAAAQQGLTELIARSRFRPRLTDGEFARTSRVVVRYFVSE